MMRWIGNKLRNIGFYTGESWQKGGTARLHVLLELRNAYKMI